MQPRTRAGNEGDGGGGVGVDDALFTAPPPGVKDDTSETNPLIATSPSMSPVDDAYVKSRQGSADIERVKLPLLRVWSVRVADCICVSRVTSSDCVFDVPLGCVIVMDIEWDLGRVTVETLWL